MDQESRALSVARYNWVLVFLFLSPWVRAETGAQPADSGVATWPSECHVLSRVESLLKSDELKDKQEEALRPLTLMRKFDVVCISDRLRLTSPIRTNGGDVLIFADSVELAAPIDTRIARRERLSDHFLDPKKPLDSYGYRAGREHNALGLINSGRNPKLSLLRSAYADYYCSECFVGSDGETYTFARPAGLTPTVFNVAITSQVIARSGWHKHDGLPPPDAFLDEEAYRPGKVLIFADTVNQSASSGQIVVTGNNGGIGGAGEPPNCIGQAQEEGWFCPSSTIEPPSLNAPGGRGGDGGIVEVVWFGRAAPNIAPIVQLGGGKPGSTIKRRSPPNDFNASVISGNVSDFPEQDSEWPASADGSDGSLILTKLDQATALREFLREIEARDALITYDLDELAVRASESNAVVAFSFADYAESAGYRMLGRASSDIAAEARTALANATASSSASHQTPAFLCSGATASPDELDAITELFKRSIPVCGEPGQRFEYFLAHSGGLMNIRNPEPLTSAQLDQIIVNTQQLSLDLQQVRTSLSRIEGSLEDIYTSTERHRVEDQIVQVRAAVTELDAAIRADSSSGAAKAQQIIHLTAAVYGMGAGVYGFGTAVGLIGDPIEPEKGKPPLTAEEKKKIKAARLRDVAEKGHQTADEIGKAREAIRALRADDLSLGAQRLALEERLNTLEKELDGFVNQQLAIKSEALHRTAQSMRDVLNARATHERSVRNLGSHFDDMLKVSVLSFIVDPSRLTEPLSANLLVLERMMSFPERNPFVIKPNRDLPKCLHSQNLPCIDIPAAPEGANIYFDLTRPGYQTLPLLLYEIAPTPTAMKLESFGVATYRVESTR